MLLQDKVAIITGAAQGIGKATALLFAQHGAKVVVTDIQLEKAKETVSEINANNGEAIAFKVDITSAEDVEQVFEQTLATYGKVDIVVNNAGFMDNFSPVGDVQDENWSRVIDINLTGTMRMCRAAVQAFLPQQHGTIINLSSAAGVGGSPAGVAYTAAKHGIIGLTKNTAFMYADQGIRCNALAPGGVNTEMGTVFKNPHQLGQQKVGSGTMNAPKLAEAQDVANVILLVASEQGSFINGAVIPVDAGWLAY
ncbi:glucose 1-dehydrogenase [Ureibacillus endophyticus]|uniref:SDR family oxidoreductase n=1 Tax=Ureibacillus endophyticus TaxID=1978490 RepID=A0A494YY55_9BACL|nr:glucose 1-dehydrogenase [Lysinibacillus endophyticus]RKQ15147.1 SDR family oxidoreductase [Lysinibacillus endophyticus]